MPIADGMNQYIVKMSVPLIGTIAVTVGALSPTQAMLAAQAQYPGSTAQSVTKNWRIMIADGMIERAESLTAAAPIPFFVRPVRSNASNAGVATSIPIAMGTEVVGRP